MSPRRIDPRRGQRRPRYGLIVAVAAAIMFFAVAIVFTFLVPAPPACQAGYPPSRAPDGTFQTWSVLPAGQPSVSIEKLPKTGLGLGASTDTQTLYVWVEGPKGQYKQAGLVPLLEGFTAVEASADEVTGPGTAYPYAFQFWVYKCKGIVWVPRLPGKPD